MEGIFYDKDLSGEIVIVDRNDLINTAKLSRSYDLPFNCPWRKKRRSHVNSHYQQEWKT